MIKNMILDAMPRTAYLYLKRWDYKKASSVNFEREQAMRSIDTTTGYSFKPFDEKEAIFIHIPKCAGVSINRTIFGNLAGGHTTLNEYMNIFEPRCINKYFKFTIVRNPWDRLVSSYFFLEKGGFGEKDFNFFKEELSSFVGFSDFVKKWVNKENIWKWHHFRPQYHYMLDNRGKVPLDFIGFLENIDDDFDYIAKKLNIRANLPKSNRSSHQSYKHYYNNETIKIVEDVYSEDINMLGYDFSNNSLSNQIVKRNTFSNR